MTNDTLNDTFRKNALLSILNEQVVSPKAKANILKLYESFGLEKIFGIADEVEVFGLTEKSNYVFRKDVRFEIYGEDYRSRKSERLLYCG